MAQKGHKIIKRVEKHKRTSLRSLLIATSLWSFYDHEIWGLFVLLLEASAAWPALKTLCCVKYFTTEGIWNSIIILMC